MEAYIIPAAFGLGTLMLALVVVEFLDASSNRFKTHLDDEPQGRDSTARVVRAVGTAFEVIGRPFPGMAEKLDIDLTFAGRPYGGVSGTQYLAASVVLSVVVGAGVGVFFALNAMINGEPAITTFIRWWIGGAIFILAFFLIDVNGAAKKNSDAIEREFPFFLDLAVLVVQAGGTPRKALGKYVEASPGSPLSREIAITAKDADATSFDDALHRMIDRVQAPSVKAILKNLAQGEKSSGEAEAFYSDQAEELRYLREEMASRTAERLKTNIVMPVFLMLMSIIIAALAPTIVSIRSQGFF